MTRSARDAAMARGSRHAVVSYPDLAAEDRRWVEAIRAQYDPQAARLAAHFTLVFPTEVTSGEMTAAVLAVVGLTAPITFVIRRAEAVRDVVGGGGHVFLVPDPGADEIVTLHDRLYGGVLRPHLREDIPFVPHMTVAAGRDFGWCEAVAEGLNRDPRRVAGVLKNVELVEIGDGTVSSTRQFILGKE